MNKKKINKIANVGLWCSMCFFLCGAILRLPTTLIPPAAIVFIIFLFIARFTQE